MTHQSCLRNVAVALALVAAQGCKPDSRKQADKAADRVVDKQQALGDERDRLADKKLDEVKQSKHVVEKSGDLADATATFEARRDVRIAALRAMHQVIATQPELISNLAQSLDLTDKGRADVNEKLQVFQMRLDETGNLIQSMKQVDAQEFKDRNDATADAMNRLEDARKDAWKALDDAPRTDRAS